VQVALKGGQGSGDNGLVNRGHHQGQRDDGEDQEPPGLRGAGINRGVRRLDVLLGHHA
jgi:hypothetical protein